MVNELQEVQWAYLLSPEFELINSGGKPLTGGWIEVYIHGTRTKYYCASDFTGTLHPFRIPLDSLGANIVLASPANAYDVYVYNKFGSLVMSRYNVSPQVAGTTVVSGGVVLDSSDGTITIEQTGDNIYDLSIADIIDSVTANIDESITNINNEITEITQVVTGLPTHADVYDAVVTGIDYTINTVTGLIPEAQVQSDWDEDNPSDPAYILNKPDLDNFVTEQELIEVVSGISGFNLEYGQFYCQTTTGGAVMGRTKGNIDVTNDGKIKLKKGQSYHVTVRGGYSKATASAEYNVLSYIEYITGQNINVNVDNSVTDTQYFEISYDLYKLSSDKDYYVFFSLPTGSSVNNLFIEIHSIGCMGTGGSGSGVPVEYDAGWGINIVDNVISVDPSILNQYVTQEELASAVSGLAPEYTAGDNIVIDNDTISLSDVVTIHAREGETSSGSISFGNIVHWGQQDYGPGWTIEAYTDQGREYHSYNTCDIGLQSFFWGDYDHDRATNSVSGQSTITISEGDIKYQQGDFQSTDTLPVIWSCNQMAQDISELQEAITAVSGSFVQEQSDWAEQDSTKVDYIKNKPVEKQLIAGDNIVITESATGVIISSTGGEVSGTVQNVVEYVDSTTTPNFFNDCVTLLEQGLEPVAKYQDNIYQLWRVQTSGNTYTALGFICSAFHNFQNAGISYEHQHAYNWQLWADANGVYPGADRMGYNYLAGNGIDAVTGIVNGEHAITYSIDPMEVATAVSGLIPTGPTYSAGDGIDITNNTISVDNTVALKSDIPEQEEVEFLELVAGTNITLTESATGIVISSTGGGGSSYTAGNGIDITNDVISVDNTVALKTDIPDVSDFVTEAEVSGMIPEQEEVEFLELTAGDNISIASGVISVTGMPDITGFATKDELQDSIELVTGLIPTDYVTDAELQDSIELVTGLIPTDYATIEDIDGAVSGKSDKFTVLTYNQSTWADFTAALNKNTIVLCKNLEFDTTRYAVLTDYTEGQSEAKFTYYVHTKATNPNNPQYSKGNRDYAVVYSLKPSSTWSRKEGYVATLMLAGNGISESYNTESDRLTLSINPEQVASAISGLIPTGSNYIAGDNIDITNNVISVSGTEDLTLMNLTAGEGITITPDVSGNVEIACTSTGVTKTLLYTGSSTDSRSGTFTLSQSGYNFDRLEMTLIDVDNYVIKQVCEMPADNLVNANGTRGSSFNSITSGTQTWFKAMNWQLNSAGTTLTYWVDEIATSGDTITAINRNQTANRPIMLRIYGIKE